MSNKQIGLWILLYIWRFVSNIYIFQHSLKIHQS